MTVTTRRVMMMTMITHRQRKLERRLAREGMAPHRYSDDADNSYEHRYHDELADLPERRRGG